MLSFPSVELVSRIKSGAHPLGSYTPSKRRIDLSFAELVHRPPDLRWFAVYHELGHWWRTERIPNGLVRGVDDEEEFADGFAHFFLGTGSGASDAMFVRGITLTEESQIRDFAEGVIHTLDDALLVVA